jgi:hypothetical protein
MMKNHELINFFAHNIDAFQAALLEDAVDCAYKLLHYKIDNEHLFVHILEKVIAEDLPNKEDFFLVSMTPCVGSVLEFAMMYDDNYCYHFSDAVWNFIFDSPKIMGMSKGHGIGISTDTLFEKCLKEQNSEYESLKNVTRSDLPIPVKIALNKGYVTQREDILSLSDGINTVGHYYAMLGHELQSISVLKQLNYYQVPVVHYAARKGLSVPEELYSLDSGGHETFYDLRVKEGWAITNFKNPLPVQSSYIFGMDYDTKMLRKLLGETVFYKSHYERTYYQESHSFEELLMMSPDGECYLVHDLVSDKERDLFYDNPNVYRVLTKNGCSVALTMAMLGRVVNTKDFWSTVNGDGRTVLEEFVNNASNKEGLLGKLDTTLLTSDQLKIKLPIGLSIGHVLNMDGKLDEMDVELAFEVKVA